LFGELTSIVFAFDNKKENEKTVSKIILSVIFILFMVLIIVVNNFPSKIFKFHPLFYENKITNDLLNI
jgi:hypothetical protein